MGFNKQPKKVWPLCPEGPQQLVCVDVIDLGIVKNEKFGKDQPKIRIVFLTAETDAENKPFRISKQYTASLNEKATLRKDLESWFGRKLRDGEIDGDELEPDSIIGLNGFGNIVHSEDGKYANLQSIMPLPKTLPKIQVPRDYVRFKDKKPKDGAGNSQQSDDEPPF